MNIVDYPIGIPDHLPIIRKPNIRVELDKWDFDNSKFETINFTNYVGGYQFAKTIRNPSSSASIYILPQFADAHILEIVDPMDVIKIYESNVLKFQGFVRKVGFKGSIDADGKPQRMCTIAAFGFGAYLQMSKIGVNLAIFKKDTPVYTSGLKLAEDIQKAVDVGLTFRRMIELLTDSWFDYVKSLTSGEFQNKYISTYVNFLDGVSTEQTAGFPKELYLFLGDEVEITLWGIIQKLSEVPLNEFFFDEGPRDIYISGAKVNLNDPKTYLIGRPTPFDGSVVNRSMVQNRFTLMKEKIIPRNHLVSIDLNKSMEESYSVYICAPGLFDYSDLELIASGFASLDEARLNKYLYVPCKQDLYYIRKHGVTKTEIEQKKQAIEDRQVETTATLRNWFENNDKYLSGQIAMMVPNDPTLDIRLGDKVKLEEIDGNFYAETVSHKWQYMKGLITEIGVTRGWDRNRPIQVKDRLFRKGKHVL